MRIAVIGAGNMGSGLARQFSIGHEVMIGSRDPERARLLALEIGAAGGGTYEEALEGADAVVLAINWWNVDDTLGRLGDLSGRILIDCTNPYKDATFSEQHVFPGSSGGQEIQKKAPGARVVKGWNHIFARIVSSSPDFDGVAATALLCGDDADAKDAVAGLARGAGYDPVDVGPLSSARYMESLAGLMVTLGYGLGMGTDLAVKILRR